MRRTYRSAFYALLTALTVAVGGAFFVSPANAAPAVATAHAITAEQSFLAIAQTESAASAPAVSGEAAPVEAAGGNPSNLPSINASALPKEGRDTLALIAKGGPYPYKQDGGTFGNREGILPAKSSGYYKEYTVKTPGASDRGARRIIGGSSGEKYYTADHYASFKYIVENK